MRILSLIHILRQLGAGLGEFSYLMDAYDDLQADPVSYTHLDVYKRQGEDVSGLFYTPEQAKERL